MHQEQNLTCDEDFFLFFTSKILKKLEYYGEKNLLKIKIFFL